MLARLVRRYQAHLAIIATLVLLVAAWTLIGLIGYGIWTLVMAGLNALAGALA
ncbi:hypothetical protein [Micromonospora sp. RV43]|uniref:hypothetical protein n=1 Tax=Micromonospora sp. RV43 TaxID=1661387 RepID=UPI000ADF2840|nr:hypothetical protein [Micromonospora sp. RV43]